MVKKEGALPWARAAWKGDGALSWAAEECSRGQRRKEMMGWSWRVFGGDAGVMRRFRERWRSGVPVVVLGCAVMYAGGEEEQGEGGVVGWRHAGGVLGCGERPLLALLRWVRAGVLRWVAGLHVVQRRRRGDGHDVLEMASRERRQGEPAAAKGEEGGEIVIRV